MRSFAQICFLLLLTMVLGLFVAFLAHQSWSDYWVMKDGRRGTAVLTAPSWAGHGVFEYEYVVDGVTLRGKSQRNWDEAEYRNVGVGGKSVVYYSASHPWLSSLSKPRNVIGGAAVAIFVSVAMGLLFVITIVSPNSRWAMATGRNATRGGP